MLGCRDLRAVDLDPVFARDPGDGFGILVRTRTGLPQADRLDAFLARYNANGTLAWPRQMGSVGNDVCYNIAVDGSARVYVIGISQNGLDGASPGAFLRRYSSNGTLEWTRTFGCSATVGSAIAVDIGGNAYIAGDTTADLRACS